MPTPIQTLDSLEIWRQKFNAAITDYSSKLNSASPSYTGGLTGDTGIVNIGGGQLYKAVDGKIGIGTTSPQSNLHVTNSGASGVLSLSGSSGQSVLLMGNSDGSGAAGPAVIVSANRAIRFGVGTSFGSSGGTITEYARLDSGNFGLGVVPSSWNGIIKAIDVGPMSAMVGSTGSTELFHNCYFGTSSAFFYKTAGAASKYQQQAGSHIWSTAASGAAGASFTSFTQAMMLDAAGSLQVNMPAAMGYGTGSGGTVTQATSRTTGVTINKPSGQITLFSAAGSATWQTFTVTNSTVTANDFVKVIQKSGTDKYMIHVTNVSAGSFQVTFATTGGTTTEQPVFTFAVFRGATA